MFLHWRQIKGNSCWCQDRPSLSERLTFPYSQLQDEKGSTWFRIDGSRCTFSLFTLIFMCKPQSLERLIFLGGPLHPNRGACSTHQHPAELYSGHHFPFGRPSGMGSSKYLSGKCPHSWKFPRSDHPVFRAYRFVACSLDLRGSEVKPVASR